MDINQLRHAVTTEVTNYINANDESGSIDTRPLVRMIEIHFSNLNAQVDITKFLHDSVGGFSQFVLDQASGKGRGKNIKKIDSKEVK